MSRLLASYVSDVQPLVGVPVQVAPGSAFNVDVAIEVVAVRRHVSKGSVTVRRSLRAS